MVGWFDCGRVRGGEAESGRVGRVRGRAWGGIGIGIGDLHDKAMAMAMIMSIRGLKH